VADQAARSASPAASPPAALSGASPLTVISGRVVDATSGAPLPATQVFIPDRDLGVLSGTDGTFTLSVPGTGAFTVVAQRIGYGQAEQDLSVRTGDTVSTDFRLREQSIQLDEIVVTGTPTGTQRPAIGNTASAAPDAAETTPVGPTLAGIDAWAPRGRAAAEAAVGFSLLTVPDLPVRAIEVGALAGTPIVRVLQELRGGGVLALFQSSSGLSARSLEGVGASALASVRRGTVAVVASAPLSTDSMAALLTRLR
jgi:hypothetical protein